MSLCLWSKSDKIVEMAQLLISNGIDVNQKDRYGTNALIWLCYRSNNNTILEVAQLLIANGIDVKKTRKD